MDDDVAGSDNYSTLYLSLATMNNEHSGLVAAEGKDGGLVSTNNKRHKNVLQVGLWMMVGCP